MSFVLTFTQFILFDLDYFPVILPYHCYIYNVRVHYIYCL